MRIADTVCNLNGRELVLRNVVVDNHRAIALYKKKGFEIYGTFPNNIKYKDGTYADACRMMKKL